MTDLSPRPRSAPSRIGVVVYEDVEPIDIGGTVGVVSMARRLLPGIESVVIAATPGVVKLAGGLGIIADYGFADAPDCDSLIVTGGPGWRRQVEDPATLAYLRRQQAGRVASVCTGALILAAAGVLSGRQATTRRTASPAEARSPVAELAAFDASIRPRTAAIVDDQGSITSGGVSLAIDGTLYVIGRLYGVAARDDVMRLIEYDRAFAANRDGLGHLII